MSSSEEERAIVPFAPVRSLRYRRKTSKQSIRTLGVPLSLSLSRHMSLCIHLVGPRVGEGVVVAGDGAVGCGAPPLGLEVGILVGVFRQRQRVGALVGILY